ncbi:hypothetical protein F960_02884 [Acinetobacter gerneri DSM 14967 = CIP 107464 = MTCC 9824]|uniref:Uncharacterized protein n=1 Tax=Acinetobacter gerneri DSM 14967 = CIP 107464 = MTCC 9824 TaxID=1120926 RepID=N8Y8S7_9GAMM|nr:hypothetical protein F960_02884 [Acinetobacter gerneri DSM 14967 = CIP 107464 = MTCC 9824]
MALSDSWLKSINGKPRDKIEVINDKDSLSVRISPNGEDSISIPLSIQWSRKMN